MSYWSWKPDCCLCESNFGEIKYLRKVQHFLQCSQALSTHTEVFLTTKLFLCILVFSFCSKSAFCEVICVFRCANMDEDYFWNSAKTLVWKEIVLVLKPFPKNTHVHVDWASGCRYCLCQSESSSGSRLRVKEQIVKQRICSSILKPLSSKWWLKVT